MPFRKRNGEYYFEVVEAFGAEIVNKELEAQYLALCPTCAAMYNEFMKHDTNAMTILRKELLDSTSGEVPLTLGTLNTSIKFVEKHFLDFKTILKIEK